MPTVIRGCKQVSCNVLQDGKCIENLKPQECGYALWDETAIKSGGEERGQTHLGLSQLISGSQFHFPLYLGEDLTAQLAYPITCSELTRVVALAGSQDCGKTSLIACMFELFQRGPFAGYLFAGSKTLRGLELRCFNARLESGRSEQAPDRTPDVDEFRFLHLAVRPKTNDCPIRPMLFSDITGEAFNAARNSSAGAERLSLFRRADHFALMIDGESIAAPEKQHREASQIQTLMRSLIEGQVLTHRSIVNVLVNKWDIILDSERSPDLQQYLENLCDNIKEKHRNNLGKISFHNIAVQPKSEAAPMGFGMEELFTSWVEDSLILSREYNARDQEDRIGSEARAFLQYRYEELT